MAEQPNLATRVATSGLFALIIGVLAWSPFGHPVFAAGMLLPIGLYSSGRSVVVSQGAYYLGSLWPMPWVVVKFYGLSGYLGWTYGVAALVSWVAILTVGFAIAWVATKWLGAMRPAVCLALTAVPPVGWLALAHPLHAAGWIFPGLAWVGLAAAFCLSALPSLRNQYGRVFVGVFSVVLAVVSNLLARQPEAPSGWRSFEVPTGPIPIDSRTAYTQIGQVRDLIKSVQRDHTKVVVLPEAVVGKWSARTDYWLNSPSLKLPADLVVVAGAMRSASASADVGLVNSAMLFRSDHGKMVAASVLDSRVPIPSGQWWPGGPSWRPSNMMKFNGQTVAVSICYEDLLPWTALGSVAERPDVVVDMSNLWFDFHHAVDHAESQTLSGWARLFGVPIVRSVGTGTPTENQQP